MPSRYRRDAPRLKAEIVARTDAGETLRAICASPDLPAADAVRSWARADAAFAEALAGARRRAAWRRLWTFDEAKAEAFLARARAGEPIKSLLGHPGMPSAKQYHRWRTAQPPFAEATFALRQRSNTRLGERGRARRRDFDQVLADRIIVRMNQGSKLADILAADPELPGEVRLARWRRAAPDFDRVLRMIVAARRRAPPAVPVSQARAVVAHIIEGGSFASFSRLPGAPSEGVLRRWMRDPHFAEQVTRACEFREDWYEDQILLIAERTSGSIREMERATAPLRLQLARLRRRPGAPPPGRRG